VKIEIEQLEKVTSENSERLIEKEAVKLSQLEKDVQDALGSVTKYSELPAINANPQDSAEVILYVRMPDGKMTPHTCPITYLAEYLKDYLKETIIVGE
jgi:hypothetical protein